MQQVRRLVRFLLHGRLRCSLHHTASVRILLHYEVMLYQALHGVQRQLTVKATVYGSGCVAMRRTGEKNCYQYVLS